MGRSREVEDEIAEGGGGIMRTALATRLDSTPTETVTIQTTLLELVRAVSETTDDDTEVVSTIVHMLQTGSVELCGTFRNEPIESF